MASDDELEARIAGYLQDPAMWEPASTSGEDDLVAAIAAQRQTSEAPHVAPGRERRRSTRPFLAGVAAALLVVAGVAAAVEVVRSGEQGLLVDGGNVEVLMQALERLLRDAEERRAMGQAAAARVERGFSWNDYGDRIVRAYAAALRTRQGTAEEGRAA